MKMPVNIPDGYWTGPVPRHPFGKHRETTSSPQVYVDAIDQLRQKLAERGIRLSPGSRLLEYRKQVLGLRAALERNEGNFRFGPGLNALFEARTLVVGLGDLLDELKDPEIKRTLKGHVSTATESDETPARDWQFQLFVAALFKRTQADVHLAEPDCVIEFSSTRLGIAAKRVKAAGQMVVRLKEARDQLQRANQDGVAVVDVSKVVNQQHLVLTPAEDDRATEVVEELLSRIEATLTPRIRGVTESRMLAYVLVANVPTAWNRAQFGTTSVISVVPLIDREDLRTRDIHAFMMRLRRGLRSVP